MDKFTVGECYTHEEVYQTLGVGNAGGIRPAMGNDKKLVRLVIMTTSPNLRILQENPYCDRIEGDTLVFTAAGRAGDQPLSGVNARLIAQSERVLPVYAFLNTDHRRKSGRRRWRFLGLVQYQRHFKETQLDSGGSIRAAWVCEYRIATMQKEVVIRDETALARAAAEQIETLSIEDQEIQQQPPGTGSPAGEASWTVGEVESKRKSLLALTPIGFERTVKRILEVSGFSQVQTTKASGDGGIDVNALAGPALWPLGRLHLQVQAKRWMHSVGRKEVAELRGSLEPHARGLLISTGYFTKAALIESAASARAPVTLVDGWEFSKICLAKDIPLAV